MIVAFFKREKGQIQLSGFARGIAERSKHPISNIPTTSGHSCKSWQGQLSLSSQTRYSTFHAGHYVGFPENAMQTEALSVLGRY